MSPAAERAFDGAAWFEAGTYDPKKPERRRFMGCGHQHPTFAGALRCKQLRGHAGVARMQFSAGEKKLHAWSGKAKK